MENNHSKKLETKEELVRTIREWVKNDNEIRALQREHNKRREIKKQISEDLITVMKNNNIDCFDINDGKLMYTEKM
jgi:seryl-tRNA synthetase